MQPCQKDESVIILSSEDEASPTGTSNSGTGERLSGRVQAALDAEDIYMDSDMPTPAQANQTGRASPEEEADCTSPASPIFCRLVTPSKDIATQTETIGAAPVAALFWQMMDLLNTGEVSIAFFSFALS